MANLPTERSASTRDTAPQHILSASSGSGRDHAIDTVRGICIVMMISSHMAAGSLLDKITHPSVWVDGASGFVLFSGLLVGIVQRSVRERSGDCSGVKKLGKRIVIVYSGHLWLCLVAFATVALAPSRDQLLPSVQDQGGITGAVIRTLTLQINPYYASILSLYVVVMLAALASVWLLRRGLLGVLVAVSAALVVFGTALPEFSALPREAGVPGPITLASWNGLFTIGLIAGWYWRTDSMKAFMRSRIVLWVSVAATGSGIFVARLLGSTDLSAQDWWKDAFSKDQMGPGRILISVLTYYLLYRLLTYMLENPIASAFFAPLALLGKRSLDSYLILSTILLTLPAVLKWNQDSWVGIIIAIVVGILCLVWAWIRSNYSLLVLGAAK